ncbi:MAG: glycine cleavage system aminomethyltransferase GcvT [Candidatus Aureabacteria bacterium]|nr:glycine cleavage system aminomethyltransferase GcvT [Candidatus Auribacterota bacterium]
MQSLKKSPLNEVHINLGAKMVPFAGWLMPIQYSGIIDEHLTVREKAGLFDLTHMGEIIVTGPRAEEYVQKLITNNTAKLADGKAFYTVICFETGGIVDDVIVYRFKKDEYMFVVNASNADKVFAWFRKKLIPEVKLIDKSPKTALLAVQGPASEKILLNVGLNVGSLNYFEFTRQTYRGIECIIARTGYTGEDGFEIFFPVDYAFSLWATLNTAGKKYGLKPVGLGARDTLRIEVGYPLYGNEIDEKTNPVEAGLSWVVDMEKDFIGKESLKQYAGGKTARRLIGFRTIERAVPRAHYDIFSGGNKVGYVTSGTLSPSLDRGIGMGYVPAEMSEAGSHIDISIRGKMVKAEIVKKPFYTGGSIKRDKIS